MIKDAIGHDEYQRIRMRCRTKEYKYWLVKRLANLKLTAPQGALNVTPPQFHWFPLRYLRQMNMIHGTMIKGNTISEEKVHAVVTWTWPSHLQSDPWQEIYSRRIGFRRLPSRPLMHIRLPFPVFIQNMKNQEWELLFKHQKISRILLQLHTILQLNSPQSHSRLYN